MPKRKIPSAKKSSAKKRPASKKKLAPKKKAAKRKSIRRKKIAATRGVIQVANPISVGNRRGLGAASGGQSGDTEGLSRREDVDSEGVEELAEEGQDYEAEIVSGVENAKDPDQGEVTTREVPEDDVPPEYTDRD
jgi:hypothetical protein